MAQTILEEKKKSRLMTEGSIWKSILLFSVPLILGNMLQQLYNTADSIIVGNFVGSNALAAVGSSGSPIFLLIGFSQGIAVGAGVVVSQFLGAKDREGAHTAVHTSLALSAILGAILTVCGIAVSRALLTAMNTPAEVLEDAVLYIRLYFGGVLFSVVYNMAAGILNAAGNSKRSLLYCWVSVKQFSKNDTATACQDWLRSTRLGRGSIKSHVRTVKVLGMGLFAFQERIHLWKGVTH